MPTGYTADVVDGKITEFADFAMTCARAFGALITLRDDPLDAPIPDVIEPHTDYRERSIAESTKRLDEIRAMTDDEATAAARAEYETSLRERDKYLADKAQEAARITAMLAKVHAWEPPTPDHQEMKRFMVEQLTISMPGSYVPAMPALRDGPTWRAEKIADLIACIDRDKAEMQKEIARAASRTEWLKSLRASLAA